MDVGLHGDVLLRRRPYGVSPPVVAGLVRMLGACRSGHSRFDPDALLVLGGVLESDDPGDRREHGVILAEAGTGAGEEGHPSLAHDDRSGRDGLSVPDLHAEPLADAVASVLRTRASLLVGHLTYSSFFVVRGFFAGSRVVVAAGLDVALGAAAFLLGAAVLAGAVVLAGAAVLAEAAVLAPAPLFGCAAFAAFASPVGLFAALRVGRVFGPPSASLSVAPDFLGAAAPFSAGAFAGVLAASLAASSASFAA